MRDPAEGAPASGAVPETLAARLAAIGDARPEHPAVVEGDTTTSYGALRRDSLALAADLRARGAGRGTHVAVALPNGAAFVRAFFAIARLGSVVVPLNPSLPDEEIASTLADAGASLLLCSTSRRGPGRWAVVASGRMRPDAVVAIDDGPGAGRASPPDTPVPAADDPVLVLHSSGSTGGPRPVARTHRQLLWEADRLGAALALSPSDRVLGVAPFSHVNGLMRSMVTPVLSGATLVTAPSFERRAVGRLVDVQRVSVFIGVPFMFAVLGETRWPSPVNLGSLRWCLSSSAPLRPETSRRFHRRYGIHVRQLYGTTETGTISVDLDPDIESHLGSVGRPLPGVRVEVFSEGGEPLPPDQVGEVGVSSPAAAREYRGLPEETGRAFRRGYFFPGDLGRWDREGRLHLVGRTSLFINRGGYKVNPQEVERVLERHPAIREAAVLGIDAPYGDQQVKAVVVLRAPCPEEDIVAFCQARLADYKVPSVVEFRTELPRSSTGKLLRPALR
jgi:long-chain acyl-CoA synthetase